MMRLAPIVLILSTLHPFAWAQTAAESSTPSCLSAISDSTATHVIEDIVVPSGDIELRGSLYLPTDDGPFPSVVLMHGGGNNVDRLRNTPEFFAPRLAACGIAAIVYDKRGTGESGGDYSVSTFDDFVDDAGHVAEVLAARSDMDAANIGIVGFSQGGRLAPVTAVRYPVVRFAASVSGPLTSVEDTRYFALENSFSNAGVADSVVSRVMPLWRTHLDGVATGDRVALERLDEERAPLVGTVHPALIPPPSTEIPRNGIYNSMGRDYSTELAGLSVPWLAIFGEMDASMPVEASLELLETRMAEAENERARVHVEPGVGHSFVDAETGERYRFVETIIKWILEITRDCG